MKLILEHEGNRLEVPEEIAKDFYVSLRPQDLRLEIKVKLAKCPEWEVAE